MQLSKETSRRIYAQCEHRRLWSHQDDKWHLTDLIEMEVKELAEAIDECQIGQSAFALASEIGDILFLIERYEIRFAGLTPQLLDYRQQVFNLCQQVGIDPDEAVMMKVQRNSMKYPDDRLNFGDHYDDEVVNAKLIWKMIGGDAVWSQAYLDILAKE
jgi:hypothetical protein